MKVILLYSETKELLNVCATFDDTVDYLQSINVDEELEIRFYPNCKVVCIRVVSEDYTYTAEYHHVRRREE